MSVLKNLQEALYKLFTSNQGLQNTVVCTAIMDNTPCPYIHICDIVTIKAPWNNDKCLQCQFTIKVCTESYDNITCLKVVDLLQEIIYDNSFTKQLQKANEKMNLISSSVHDVITSISQNSNNLTWEGQLKVILYMKHM